MSDWRERIARAEAAGWRVVTDIEAAYFIDPEGRWWGDRVPRSDYMHRAFLVDCGWHDEDWDFRSYDTPAGMRPALEAGFIRRSAIRFPGDKMNASYDALGSLRDLRKSNRLLAAIHADVRHGNTVEVTGHPRIAPDTDNEWAGCEDALGLDEFLSGRIY